MNTKIKQLILITLLILFLVFIFFFFTKNSFTNITGGVIANANTINANQIIFRLNSPTVTTTSSSTSLQPTVPSTPPPAPTPGPSSVNTPPTIPTITPPTPTTSSTGAPPYFSDTWDSTYPLAVYYSSTPFNANSHACTSNNLVGYVDGTNFYPEGTTTNVANADQVCYDNFDCQKCQFTTPGACDAFTQQGYTCMFSFQPTNGGTVASCNFYQYNYMCKDIPPATPPPSCNHIVLGNSVGTDSILFRVAYPPNTSTSPAPPNAWNSRYGIAVTNDGAVGPNPHACAANNANRIGHVDGNFFYSINSTSLPLTNVPTPVCYSNFICQPCTHANGGCNVYYANGYVPYFSISSLSSSKIQDCGISTYNYVCKEQIR